MFRACLGIPSHSKSNMPKSQFDMGNAGEENLWYLGTHGALTGVYNRAYFEEELERLKRGRGFSPVSVVTVDVDGMKAINDSLGHAAGDAVVLASAFRNEDVVARIGGDEFAVLLPASDKGYCGESRDTRQEAPV